MITKTCTKCGEVKPLEDFYRSNWGGKFGHTSACKVCEKARFYKWREENGKAKSNNGRIESS